MSRIIAHNHSLYPHDKKAWQQAHRIEERKKETTFTRNVVTQEEYEKVLAKAKDRLGQLV